MSAGSSRRLLVRMALALTTAGMAAGCGGEPDGDRSGAGRDTGATMGARRGLVTAVQLGSFADSANAVVLRDSLVRAGWTAYVAPVAPGGERRWRVLVQPTVGTELPRLVQLALRAQGRDAVVVRDTVPSSVGLPPTSVDVFPVNRGPEGMLRRVRWAMSPDRRSMLAVEDPAGVENEPEPNGFVFVAETGPFLMQVDSVWDVSPSPDWQRLAYGRAYVVMSTRESPDEITAGQWAELAERAGLTVDSLRRSAFPSSAMNIAYATAQPVVVDVSDRALGADVSPQETERTLVMAGGWRVGWTGTDGGLAVGAAPLRATDDAPPARWIVADTARGAPARVLPAGTEPWSVDWTEGPLLDISVPFDANAPRSIAIEGGRITSRQGWIRIRRDDAAADSIAGGRIIGPGAALAATASGRFIAALVPRATRDQFEVPLRFIVYQITD